MQSDKVIILTGGSSGIGRAAALRFARQGDKVLVTGRRAGPLDQLASEHPNIIGLVADAGSAADAGRTVTKALELWGRVDALINNAGAGAILSLADITAERIADIFSVNVFGPSLLASAALPHLREQCGAIVNVSSTFGHRPAAALSHYAASKAALEHLNPLLGAGTGAIRHSCERGCRRADRNRRLDWHDGPHAGAGGGG
jgi:NAD(P)-dependent dehydrogenase (short-subunit alcohol dehydrogenase family)